MGNQADVSRNGISNVQWIGLSCCCVIGGRVQGGARRKNPGAEFPIQHEEPFPAVADSFHLPQNFLRIRLLFDLFVDESGQKGLRRIVVFRPDPIQDPVNFPGNEFFMVAGVFPGLQG